ncbi:hypothetical protein QRB36_11260 [Mycobacterium marseillense]|uniref:hypothetical protein n=1 Tax=Mycobacterium marseillense TaxID=701042 RepID=UPI002593943B|nr:hypothetical protein [Mycobacterium marseillense]MDM3974746.1 hypothetical protein [Mycobacterium marseillense]
MARADVLFIDTSVLCNLLRVPGRCDRADEMQDLFYEHVENNVKFVLPITSIIETGNFIQQCSGDRYAAAHRFRASLEAAAESSPPWVIHRMNWDEKFINALIAGDSTGSTLVEHFANKLLGAGDLSVLVERDLYAASRAVGSVEIWTIDEKLDSYRRA